MSSTLDDQEPYEIFQNELDAYLKDYEKFWTAKNETSLFIKRSFVLNRFIEFVCFTKTFISIAEITDSTENEFYNHNQNELKEICSLNDVSIIVHDFLSFIKK